jgi:hypothetical protein
VIAWSLAAAELRLEHRESAAQRADLKCRAQAAHTPDGDGRSKDEEDSLEVHAVTCCNASAPRIHEYHRQPAASAGNAQP